MIVIWLFVLLTNLPWISFGLLSSNVYRVTSRPHRIRPRTDLGYSRYNHRIATNRDHRRHKETSLNTLGDPDLDLKWTLLRYFQEFARIYDNLLFDDPDTPGWTFPSPIIWTPWMDTIWFGNFYEYRTAYFQDVMYSNYVPNREGALLYRDPNKALAMAILYQRYKKFDTSCYSISNSTMYNVFATQSMRLGRYKIPLSNEIILCVTDPLTMSEMKRYLTSFQVLKYFKSLFFQQKRKRQYIIDISKSSKTLDWVYDCFECLEYGRLRLKYKQIASKMDTETVVIATLPTGIISNENIQDLRVINDPIHQDSGAEVMSQAIGLLSNGSQAIADQESNTEVNEGGLRDTNTIILQSEDQIPSESSIDASNSTESTAMATIDPTNSSIDSNTSTISSLIYLQQESQLLMRLSDMNSQYLIENLLQTIVTLYRGDLLRYPIPHAMDPDESSMNQPQSDARSRAFRVLMGCDGSLLSDYFLRLAIRVMAGQSESKDNVLSFNPRDYIDKVDDETSLMNLSMNKSTMTISLRQFDRVEIIIPSKGLLTTSEARSTMNSAAKSMNPIDMTILFTCGESSAGIRGSSGLSVLIPSIIEGTTETSSKPLTRSDWQGILRYLPHIDKVSIYPMKLSDDILSHLSWNDDQMKSDSIKSIHRTASCEILPPTASKGRNILSILPQKAIKHIQSYLKDSDPIFIIDCMNIPSTIQYVSSICDELGLDIQDIGINMNPITDFNGKLPKDTNSYETFALFRPEMKNSLEEGESEDRASSFDFGFIVSGDARSCLILAGGMAVHGSNMIDVFKFYLHRIGRILYSVSITKTSLNIDSLTENGNKIDKFVSKLLDAMKCDAMAVIMTMLMILSYEKALGLQEIDATETSSIRSSIHEIINHYKRISNRDDLPITVLNY